MVGNFLARRVMSCQRRVHSAYEYAGSQDPTRMHQDGLEKSEIQRLINELFNFADNNFVRSDDRMHAFKLGRSAPKVNECVGLVVLLFEYCSLLTDDMPPLSQIGDIDRCSVYVSLAPGMDHPAGVDPPGRQCCSVSPIHQQRQGPEPSSADHGRQGGGEEANGCGAISHGSNSSGDGCRAFDGPRLDQPCPEAASAREDRRRQR